MVFIINAAQCRVAVMPRNYTLESLTARSAVLFCQKTKVWQCVKISRFDKILCRKVV